MKEGYERIEGEYEAYKNLGLLSEPVINFIDRLLDENKYLQSQLDHHYSQGSDHANAVLGDINEASEGFNLDIEVTHILHHLGVPAHLKGYLYLREAIRIAYYEIEDSGPMARKLYTDVAKKYETTPSRVERAIRHAIETAWKRGSADVLSKTFAHTINIKKSKTTNSEFVAMITDRLRLLYKNQTLDDLSVQENSDQEYHL